jgi:hypothetical protein
VERILAFSTLNCKCVRTPALAKCTLPHIKHAVRGCHSPISFSHADKQSAAVELSVRPAHKTYTWLYWSNTMMRIMHAVVPASFPPTDTVSVNREHSSTLQELDAESRAKLQPAHCHHTNSNDLLPWQQAVVQQWLKTTSCQRVPR